MTDSQHLPAETLARAWAALLRQTAEAVLLVGPEGRVLAASAAAARLLGGGAAPGADPRAALGLPAGAELGGPAALPDGQRVELRPAPLGGADAAALVTLELTGEESLEHRLREVTLAISSGLDIDETLARVVRLSTELLGADAGSLPLYDAQHDVLLPAYLVNLDLNMPVHPRGVGVVWDVIDSGVTLRSNDYANDPRALSSLKDRAISAALGVPVAAGTQILGALIMYHFRPGRQFSARDQELLEIVGRQAGVAIQNARLYAEALRESERRALLYQASVSFGAALAPQQLYAAIHRAVRQLMACDSIAIGLYDEPAASVEYVYIAEHGRRWPGRRVPLGRGLLSYIIREGLTLRIGGSDPETEALFGAERFVAEAAVTQALLATPLRVGEQIIGAFTVQALRPDAYSSLDLDALETLAATAAIAIQNAQLFTQVEALATRDALTGAFNRRHFFELARRELERAARYAHPLSMLMLDADHFKQINDTYGHVAGDQVLRAIAARCAETLREVDVVARYGGEEFLVLMPETGRDAALLAAERLRASICRMPVESDAGPVAVSVSIGVASSEGERDISAEQLLDHVDRALYAAKRGGRNQISAYRRPAEQVR